MEPTTPPRPHNRTAPRVALILCLAAAALARLAALPQPYELRHVDEPTYLKSGLQVLEGIQPGNAAAPGGPQIWVAWLYGAGLTAKHMLAPGPEERAVRTTVRPYFALNHALFDTYRDLSRLRYVVLLAAIALAVWATWAAFRLGVFRAGLPGGVLLGGVWALLPLGVEFAAMSRSYAIAWSFAMLALYYAAAGDGPRRWMLAAAFLGLAIGSRIEMLTLAPLVLWEFWYRPAPGSLLKNWVVVLALAAAVAVLAAPWLVTNLLGNLRTILTVRFASTREASPARAIMGMLVWQGLGPLILLLLITTPLVGPPDRWKRWGLTLVVLALLWTAFQGSTSGLHQQGAVIVALLAASTLAFADLARRWPRAAWPVAVAALVLPSVGLINLYQNLRTRFEEDRSVAWIEANVPAGTRVYIGVSGMRVPLPTTEAADRAWEEVTGPSAWRAKFQAGLNRLGLGEVPVPRAMSEANLISERGLQRAWFILGGRPDVAAPRYDVRVRGVITGTDLPQQFLKSGGVLLWEARLPDAEFGEPVMQWAGRAGEGVYAYASPDALAAPASAPSAARP